MISADFKRLLHQTLFAPRMAAVRLMKLQLPEGALWLALVLVAVLNGLFVGIGASLMPPEQLLQLLSDFPSVAPVLKLAQNPVSLVLINAVSYAIFAFAATFAGRVFNGKASLSDILVVLSWLMLLMLVGLVGLTFLAVALPSISAMLILVLVIWCIVILVQFIDAAHRFANGLKSFGVLLLAYLLFLVAKNFIFVFFRMFGGI